MKLTPYKVTVLQNDSTCEHCGTYLLKGQRVRGRTAIHDVADGTLAEFVAAHFEPCNAELRKAAVARTDALVTRRQVLQTYLTEVTREEDWHGVMDAAADLREVDAELRGLELAGK